MNNETRAAVCPKLFFLLKYYLFWIGLSIVARSFFLLFHAAGTLTVNDCFHIFFRGLQMDLSWGGYVMMLISLIMAVTPYLPERMVKGLIRYITLCLIVFFWFIIVADLELFKHWGYHMDATPLLYIKTPKAALASVSYFHLFLLLLLMLALIIASYFVYKKWIAKSLRDMRGVKQWWHTLLFLMICGSLIIPVRGGLNLAPLNSSFVYFHKTNMLANQAAVNPVWNFIYEVSHINKSENEYQFMPEERAEQLVDSLNDTGNDFPGILKSKTPNVIVVLLESFTADAIEGLGGDRGITPNLNQLAKEGVTFSRIYATGNRSDRGITAVIGAIPAHPNYTLIKNPNKAAKFPSFPKDMENSGYHTKFYYAGDINFGRFRSYITMNFQDMVTEDHFDGEALKNKFKWGIHDEYMFDYLFNEIKNAPQPYMYMAFTMSSHEPFDVPMETVIKGDSEDKRFLNAIHYTDRCVGSFVEKLKTNDLWENTLLVLIADHGTIKIKSREAFDPEAFHIPMIFTGGVLSVRDTVITTIGSQTDMIKTLLCQLSVEQSGYRYGKNLLVSDVIPFAYYAFNNTAGMITEKGLSIYDTHRDEFLLGDTLQTNKTWLKAYLQQWNKEIKP